MEVLSQLRAQADPTLVAARERWREWSGAMGHARNTNLERRRLIGLGMT